MKKVFIFVKKETGNFGMGSMEGKEENEANNAKR